jgi:uroporphyrinogen decarboxylase
LETRQLFLETMKFSKGIRTVKWEFGYWGQTVKNWYKQGLPLKNLPFLDTQITTPSSSIFKAIWPHSVKDEFNFPNGIAIVGGGLYWPTQGFLLDTDIRDYFNLNECQVLVDINNIFCPQFDPKILYEDERIINFQDIDGVKKQFLKKESVIPTSIVWPIKDWKSWLSLKEERLNLYNIKKRFPENWNDLLNKYKRRKYPLVLGGYPCGFFGTVSQLMGYENLFYAYHDEPELIKDINNTFTDLWIAIWTEIISQIEIDAVHIWEDVSFGRGSMISSFIFKEFMSPYYKRLTDFLKSNGINIILVDTDGDCRELIPLFLEAGITGLYPFEETNGMNIFNIRKNYPKLQICGGIPKAQILFGEKRIDEILKPLTWMLKQGGYIPFYDHLVAPQVSWQNFKYYRERLNKIIDCTI